MLAQITHTCHVEMCDAVVVCAFEGVFYATLLISWPRMRGKRGVAEGY